jgi:Undecaprenyl-phosphate glucose phosphotransferase
MIVRQAVAARLLAMLQDEREFETRPLGEIEAELRLWGNDPTSSIERARLLAAASQSPAAALLARIEDAEATEREIQALGSAKFNDVRARLQRESRPTSAATPQRDVKGASNLVRRWLRTGLATPGPASGPRVRPEREAASPSEGAEHLVTREGGAMTAGATLDPSPGSRGRRQRSDWLSPAVIVGLLRFADAVIVVLAAVAAWITRFYGQPRDLLDVLYVCVLAVLLTVQIFQFAGLYRFERLHQLARQFRRLVPAWGAVILTVLAIGYMAQMTREFHLTSRLWIGLWSVYGLLGLVAVRALLRHQLQRWQAAGRLTRNLVILGAGELGQRLIEHLLRHGDGTQRIVGVFDDRRTRVPERASHIPIQGTLDDLLVFARHLPIDQIIVALPWDAEARLLAWTKKLQSLPVDICFCPHVGSPYPPKLTHVAGVPMLTVLAKPLSGWSYVVKSAEDRLLAAGLLALSLPVILLIALLIKSESRGPVLVRQKRYGFDNEVIAVYRFRTESVEAGEKGQRSTPIGRILYRTSLNELPQLINVLSGSMSIVGPRPSLVPHNEEYVRLIDGYLARLRVKPGITGWAQINGLRGDGATVENMERRVRHDLYYIENWSLLFDLRIILRTFFASLRDA